MTDPNTLHPLVAPKRSNYTLAHPGEPHDRLGRLHAPDPRDYPALAVLGAAATPKTYHYWYEHFDLDQAGPTCVANALAHALGDSPRSLRLAGLEQLVEQRAGLPTGSLAGYVSPSGEKGVRGWVYDQAQHVDEFPDTPPAGGTSGRAGLKVYQALGIVGTYARLANTSEVAVALLTNGPVPLGCMWYESWMVEPDGRTLLEPSGPIAGGHEVCLSGVNTQTQLAKVQTWGGHFHMTFATLDTLLSQGADAYTFQQLLG